MTTYTEPEAIIAQAMALALEGLTTYPIAWPNVKAPPIPDPTDLTSGGYYIEVFDLQNTTGRPFIANAGKSMFQGIYQITLSCPVLKGEIALKQQAGVIASGYYSLGRINVTGGHIRIQRRPTITTMKSQNGARWEAPISINWQAYL